MTRSRTALVLLAAGLAGAAGLRQRPSGRAAAVGAAPAAAATFAADPRLDSARAELDAGRFWHAALLMRAALSAGIELTPDDRLALARADAGWRNWDGVVQLLTAQPWVDGTGGGEGWLLLARALDARGQWAPAATAYGRYLGTSHGGANPLRPGVIARHARTLALAGRTEEAGAALAGLADEAPLVLSWATLDAASAAADSGRVASVRALLARVTDSIARVQGWELVPRALLASGDSAAAEAGYREAARAVPGATRRARAWAIAGDLARARGDSAAARAAWTEALAAGPATAGAVRAAARLLGMGGLDAEAALQVAQALDRADEDEGALRAYDLHVRLRGGVAEVGEGVRLDRARLLAVTAGRQEDAAAELRALSTSDRERVGAPALEHWARLRQRQGRTADVETLRGWLLERYPSSPEAADVVFFRGDARHDANDLDAAVREYRRLIAMAPDQDRAGLARMRVAQVHLLRRETALASEVYEGYLEAFPSGRRWQESAYWAARTALSMGDSARARAHVARLRADDPFSYYTVIAADLMGERFALDLPPGEAPPFPEWLAEGLGRVDLLREAGLPGGEDAEVARLTGRAAGDRGATLRLAEELIARDRTIDGINLGWELRRQGEPWTERLAKVIYPWRYEEVFAREAREDGVDPFLTAALARQESAFDPDIRSVANAVGLMQLLPATARQVARAAGPAEFREELLEVPDVNVHLGTLYLRDQLREHQGDITRFLAAYNAGPHRVAVWRDFAEAGDPLTFTERIPYAETRDYVKQVRRNLAVYKELYGGPGRPSTR